MLTFRRTHFLRKFMAAFAILLHFCCQSCKLGCLNNERQWNTTSMKQSKLKNQKNHPSKKFFYWDFNLGLEKLIWNCISAFLADILPEINGMNVKFQSEHVRVRKLTPKPVYICTIFKHLHFFFCWQKVFNMSDQI